MTNAIVDIIVKDVIDTGDFLNDFDENTLEIKAAEYAQWGVGEYCDMHEVDWADMPYGLEEAVCNKLIALAWEKLERDALDDRYATEEAILAGDMDRNGNFIPYDRYVGV